MVSDTRRQQHQHLASGGQSVDWMLCGQWEPSHCQNISFSPNLLRGMQQFSFHKEEETAWAACMEWFPTGAWILRLIYQGYLTCDVKGLASLMAVLQDHLHVFNFCSCCPCRSLSAIHFSTSWTTTFDYSISWPSGCGQPLSAMNSMIHQIPWHGSCVWVVHQLCTRTAHIAPMTGCNNYWPEPRMPMN
jgi:hypothetical protein